MIVVKFLVLIYFIMALILGFLALLLNRKNLLRMSFEEQFIFFAFQPFLYIREVVKGNNNE